jgi:predicted N-acyltransferase
LNSWFTRSGAPTTMASGSDARPRRWRQRVEHGVEQRALVEQVVAGVGRQAQFREGDQHGALRRRLRAPAGWSAGVEGRIGNAASLHILFPDEQDKQALADAGFMLREGVQFHWDNRDYADFDGFLASLKMDKRKKIRQDRRRVLDAGVTFEHMAGSQITPEVLRFFHSCYVSTYEAHYSKPYLSLKFFQRLLERMPDSLMMVLARREGQAIAVALNLVGGKVMYGRYWGTQEFISGLHFETCYVQSIEYCIRHGISRFEGGAQGVHKMSRGLVPTPTWSAHWVADQRFADAIADFLQQETAAMDDYIDELADHAPFKSN